MARQYDMSIPVVDNHGHVYIQEPIEKTYEGFEARVASTGIRKLGMLSCPLPTDLGMGPDIIENLKMLYIKDRLSIPVFAYAGFTWHWDEAETYVPYGQQMLDMGFDGFKTLEQHPRLRKELGKGLNHPSLTEFFRFGEKMGSSMICHVSEPRRSWDASKASPSALKLGRVYGADFPSPEQLFEEMEEVIARHPGMNFILAHIGCMWDDFDLVKRLLETYPNAYLDLAPGGEMFVRFTQDPALWHPFLIRHSDRILMGSDMYSTPSCEIRYDLVRNYFEGSEPFDYYGDTIVPNPLPREALDNIYWNNVHRLMGENPKPVNREMAYEYCLYLAKDHADELTQLGKENLDVMTAYWKK